MERGRRDGIRCGTGRVHDDMRRDLVPLAVGWDRGVRAESTCVDEGFGFAAGGEAVCTRSTRHAAE